mmetsp:Transcript_27933/g.63171  ORF Transcript_27933/g.63171 Transcript_27933/m.63171 type:complete len:133 (+) Transcript_27933:956-1354(+)
MSSSSCGKIFVISSLPVSSMFSSTACSRTSLQTEFQSSKKQRMTLGGDEQAATGILQQSRVFVLMLNFDIQCQERARCQQDISPFRSNLRFCKCSVLSALSRRFSRFLSCAIACISSPNSHVHLHLPPSQTH